MVADRIERTRALRRQTAQPGATAPAARTGLLGTLSRDSPK